MITTVGDGGPRRRRREGRRNGRDGAAGNGVTVGKGVRVGSGVFVGVAVFLRRYGNHDRCRRTARRLETKVAFVDVTTLWLEKVPACL